VVYAPNISVASSLSKSLLWFILLVSIPLVGRSQQYVYVNTDNLIMRDRPEKKYNVMAILHAPCKLTIAKSDVGYKNNKAVNDRFYQVEFTYSDENHRHNYVHGWVEKRYAVGDTSLITAKVNNKALALNFNMVYPEPSNDFEDTYPDEMNWVQFLDSKYKGGEHLPPPVTRVYYTGPRGGCYYKTKDGRKVYVDKSFCKHK